MWYSCSIRIARSIKLVYHGYLQDFVIGSKFLMSQRRFLIIALPALNEAATIGEVISRIPIQIEGIDEIRVIVIDDGSNDETASISESLGAEVIRHPDRRGVGVAFQTAVRYAVQNQADFLATLDSDGQFAPEDLPELLSPVINGRAEFSTASRFKDPALVPEMPEIKKWGNRRIAQLISRLTGQKFYDVSCGMRCYNRKALLNLNLIGDFTYTQEVFLNLAFKKMRIVEIPIKVRGEREFGKSRVANSITNYAINSSRIIWRAYRDYRPLRFFGILAMALLAPAVGLFGFLMLHYFNTGHFSPHKWAGFTAAALGIFAIMMFYAGMIGDMLVRHRIYLEELLYLTREQNAKKESLSDTAECDMETESPFPR